MKKDKGKFGKKKEFKIPKIETKPQTKQEIKEEESKFKPSEFISPYFGRNVKNKKPEVKNLYGGDVNKKYDAFRKKKKITDEDARKKYGTKYYEFNYVRKDEREHTETATQDDAIQVVDVQDIKDAIEQEKIEPIIETIEEKEEEPKKSMFDMEEEPEEEPEVLLPKKIIPKKMIQEPSGKYKLPPLDLLYRSYDVSEDQSDWLEEQREVINTTLEQFNIEGEVVRYTKGPTVTQFEIMLAPGVMVNKITKMQDNLKKDLQAKVIRIEAPIPGKNTIGIEVPNLKPEIVNFGNLIDDPEFLDDPNPLKVALGIDINGDNVYADISKMPHGLIAGATGSGKSVCINTILISLLYKTKPRDLRLILVDPKLVELAAYNDIPHLATPVITDSKIATASLKWVVDEMEERFRRFSELRARNIKAYNAKADLSDTHYHMPYLVIVVDELADLMMVSSHEVEDLIMRITQKARAAGIHLIVATQRPSTDVIKGTIKSNIPTRIAFAVSSYADSSTIIDGSGAEKLLGRGDMLFVENGQPVKKRLQGAYIREEEIDAITDFVRDQQDVDFMFTHEDLKPKMSDAFGEDDFDELFVPVARYVVSNQNASINRIQREFNVGFNRAATLMDLLEKNRIVSESQGSKARDVLMSIEEFELNFMDE